MKIYLYIILSIIMFVVFIQDIKYRAIHYSLLILIVLVNFVLWFNYSKDYRTLLFNLFFLITTLLGLKIYVTITKKKKTEGMYLGLGLGDLLFFLVVIPLFSTKNYIFFFITGMIFSLIMHLFLKKISNNNLIPLAGYLALYIIILEGFMLLSGNDFHNNLI